MTDDTLDLSIPRSRLDTNSCPDCGSHDLDYFADRGVIECEDCGRRYEIREVTWLEPVSEPTEQEQGVIEERVDKLDDPENLQDVDDFVDDL